MEAKESELKVTNEALAINPTKSDTTLEELEALVKNNKQISTEVKTLKEQSWSLQQLLAENEHKSNDLFNIWW
ncbi:hypothetical protein [Candidatus Endomicrobiellum trichonymphae]|uniref:hypothetical protein n=1 Tax=Endomicrobium trichonymphae TaxID=1408204 RepID=UPI0039B97538